MSKRNKTGQRNAFISFLMILAMSVSMIFSSTNLVQAGNAKVSTKSSAMELTTDGSSWSNGYSINASVKNVSTKTIQNWELLVDAASFTISDIWCAEATLSDGTYTIKPASWAQTVSTGGSINFGFTGTGAMPSPSDFHILYWINGVEYIDGMIVEDIDKPTESSAVPTIETSVVPSEEPTTEVSEIPSIAPTAPTKETPSAAPSETPSISPSSPCEDAETDDDWLHVEGTNICDKYGNKVWLTGANWFGFNCRERMFLDSYSSNIVADIDEVANKGINVVRIPIATDLLYSWSKGEYPESTDTSYNNADLAGLNSYQLFNFMLENFKRVGIKVILDVHSAETDNQGHTNPLWVTSNITEQMFKDAWVWVAERYKHDDTIIGYDLKNEPHTNTGDMKIKAQSAIWDDSSDANNWKRVAQETALDILNVNPHALIFVEGVEIYPKDGVWDDAQINTSPWYGTCDYYGTWWGGNLRGVKEHPIDLGKYQNQLVYSAHDYGPIVYNQTWFQGDFIDADDAEASDILYNKCWKDNWAYIMEDGISPMFIGEWGGKTEGNDTLLSLNTKYLRAMRDYIIANKYTMHHTFWCINIDSADTDGLFTRGEGTAFPGGRDLKWNDNKYDNYLEPTLWKNSNGKFQGLDHKVPLGENGVALGTTQQ